MRVFITGATGFIGTHVVKELIATGHQVLGLTRSEAGAQALAATGAVAHQGVLQDVSILKSGAAASDAVIHLGFSHDAADLRESCQTDEAAIEALGSALAGSNRPFIVSAGLGGIGGPGQVVTEETDIPPSSRSPRVSEKAALALLPKGVNVAVMRLSQIHDTVKQGLVSFAIAAARQKGICAYVGDGENRWAAAHVRDTARLYRLALEKPEAGARWHAVAEEGVRFKEIADIAGRGLKLPVVSIPSEQAPSHFGWWGAFAGGDLLASNAITRKKLGWNPTGPGMLSDLERMDYSKAT